MALSHPVQTASEFAIATLAAKASGSRVGDMVYGGDVTPRDAFSYLSRNHAVLIDVRTLPEWQFIGLPDLNGTHGELVTICWKLYPDFSTNVKFSDQLSAVEGVTKDTPLFFICRSGGRSLDAAVAMSALGYRYCFNVAGGFEGDIDPQGHRGTKQGWKASQLPWKQG